MNKILFISLLQAVALIVFAESNVTVPSLDIREGRQTMLTINYEFDEGHAICNYQMEVQLPEGITVVGTSVTLGECHSAHTGSIVNNIVVVTSMNEVVNGTSGMLLKIPVKASEELVAGSQLQGTLHNIKLGQLDETSINPEDVSFTISIVEDILVLDETSTTVPESETGVDVRVKRTINAGEWNTLCLPFAMTEAQVKEAFGDDAELADFTGWSSEEDEDGNIVSITVNFTDVTEVEANHPYIIKVSEDVSEFSVDGVDIQPEDEPTVQVGKKKAERGYFTGTYVADTEVPEDDIFLSGNKFWYSAGQTRMKAFRAYFEFADVLTDMDSSAAKIAMSFDKDKTGISRVTSNKEGNGATYNIAGQRVLKPTNGIFIKDGKKITIK